MFFGAVAAWIFGGELILGDSFFIQKNDCVEDSEAWSSRFSFLIDKLPSFMTVEIGEDVRRNSL